MIFIVYCFSRYFDDIEAINVITVIISIEWGTVLTIIGDKIGSVLAKTLQKAKVRALMFGLKYSDWHK